MYEWVNLIKYRVNLCSKKKKKDKYGVFKKLEKICVQKKKNNYQKNYDNFEKKFQKSQCTFSNLLY